MTINIKKTIAVLERIYNNPDTYGCIGETADAFKYAIKVLGDIKLLKEENQAYIDAHGEACVENLKLHQNLTEITMWALKNEIISMSRGSELLGIRLIEMRERTKVYFSKPPEGWKI